MTEPMFEHDCAECVFLGRLEHSPTLLKPEDHPGAEGEPVKLVPFFRTVFDLYFCPKGGRTVIARYSDSGPDYKSGLRIAHMDPELALAKQLATERGLLTSPITLRDDNKHD